MRLAPRASSGAARRDRSRAQPSRCFSARPDARPRLGGVRRLAGGRSAREPAHQRVRPRLHRTGALEHRARRAVPANGARGRGVPPGRARPLPHPPAALLPGVHVEPIDLPLAGLYALWPDPRFLLWLQAVVVALGALPAAWLAHRVVGGWIAGLVFGLAWLLAPGLEGAALSDFHAVALGATWLMAGLWLLECGRPRWAWAFLMLAAASREDGALAVSSLGVVLLLRSRSRSGWASAKARAHLEREVSASPAAGSRSAPPRRPSPIARACPRVAAAVLLPAALWTLVCFVVIAPYFTGGGNLFWSRYAWLGATPRAAVAGVLRHPGVLL